VTWLVTQKGVKADLPVRDYKLSPRFGDLTFLRTAAAVTLDAIGLGAIARQVEQTGMVQAVESLGLDGMLALWYPAGSIEPQSPVSAPPALLRALSQCPNPAPVTRFRVRIFI